jgi:hypothetical protein
VQIGKVVLAAESASGAIFCSSAISVPDLKIIP